MSIENRINIKKYIEQMGKPKPSVDSKSADEILEMIRERTRADLQSIVDDWESQDAITRAQQTLANSEEYQEYTHIRNRLAEPDEPWDIMPYDR